MRIAYLVLAHKNYRQVELLVNRLKDDLTDIYIHVDKKNSKLYEELSESYKDNEQVFILDQRVVVNWSGFSQVQATLNLINKVINTGRSYDYISLISGQCFPIKSNDYIRRFLLENKGREFIEYRDITNDDKFLYRLKIYNLFRENKNIRKLYMRIIDNIIRRLQKPFINRNNFQNKQLYHGSQWFTLTYECLSYLKRYIDDNPEVMTDFKFTLVPDEHFFQILIMNSPFKEKVINYNLRYIDWENQKNSPKTLNTNDLDKLIYSSALIARKFDIEEDEYVMRELINAIDCKENNNDKYSYPSL